MQHNKCPQGYIFPDTAKLSTLTYSVVSQQILCGIAAQESWLMGALLGTFQPY